MTTELYYLVLSAGLCLILWLPYIIGYTMNNGLMGPEEYKGSTLENLSPWSKRAQRAHYNLVENLVPFTALILVAHTAGVGVASAAAVFFWARVAHAIVYVAGIPYARTIAFTVSWLAQIAILKALLF